MSKLEDATAGLHTAASWVSSLIPGPEYAGWSETALGEWDLRALVGHTSRALLTLEAALERPTEGVELRSATDYFARTSADRTSDPAAVRDRGIAAGQALGADPARAFAVIADRVINRMRGETDRGVETIAGSMQLSDYVQTREFELTVHGIDIAVALGRKVDPPERCVAQSLGLSVALGSDAGLGVRILRALTGREEIGSVPNVLSPEARGL